MRPYQTLLYYKYTHISNPAEFAQQHQAFCERLGLVGRIIIAEEGLNGTVSGTMVQCKKYMDKVGNDPLFQGIEFKVDEVDELSFSALHVRHKAEIVNSGTLSKHQIDPTVKTGKHLEPVEFAEMKDREDVVILDVRSNYESGLGRFKNAYAVDIDNFREFPDKVRELGITKDKKILTYCTGGIKCEKASALLLAHGFEDVYQLHGGIIKYGKEMQGKDFDGNCYVFDNRVSVEVNTVNPKVITSCRICNTPSTRMVNCANATCNDHYVMCENCGWEMKGCCSEACQTSEAVRPYDGTGYYSKD